VPEIRAVSKCQRLITGGCYNVTAALLIHSKKGFNARLVLPSFELFEVAIPTVPMFTHLTFCGVVTTVTAFDVDCLAFRKINYPQFCDVIVVVQRLFSAPLPSAIELSRCETF